MAFVGSNTSDAMAGKSVLLYIATDGTEQSPTWPLIGGQRSGDLNQEGDEESVYIMSDAGVEALQTAFRNGTQCFFKYEYAGGKYQTGYGTITNFSVSAPHDDVVTVSGTISGCGPISEITTPSNG